MQAIHNPSAELRQEIEMDVEAFLKRGGNINEVPVIPAPVKKSKFVIISSRNEFKEARRKKKKSGSELVDVRYCTDKCVHHVYQGETRLTDKGFLNQAVALSYAQRLQQQIDRKSKR